jgi:hypothetical protein
MASLNFTDIADVGSKDRDSGSFLVQVSGVGVTQIDVHIEQRPPRGGARGRLGFCRHEQS